MDTKQKPKRKYERVISGGTIKLFVPTTCPCETSPDPPHKGYGQGTVWECNLCGIQKRLVNTQLDGWVWTKLAKRDYVK
jgi:hypothetical protein